MSDGDPLTIIADRPTVQIVTPDHGVMVVATESPATFVSRESEVFVIGVETPPAVVISGGVRGPRGPVGATGDAHTITVVASTPIGGHRAVVLDADEAPQYASNANVAHTHKTLGITSNAAGIGDELLIVRFGEIEEPSWNWTLDAPVFLGTNGLLTQTAPVAPAVFSRVLGFPRSATKLFIDFREPIILT